MLALLLLLLHSSAALDVLSPSNHVGWVRSPWFNYNIGANDASSVAGKVANLSITTHNHACEHPPDTTEFVGSVVLLENQQSGARGLVDERDAARCLELLGALAVVRLSRDVRSPGFQYNYNQGIQNTVGIGVLAATQASLQDVVDAVRNGQVVTVRLTVDSNEWTDMWESPWFLAVWRVFLPVTNAIAAAQAGAGIVGLVQRRTELRKRMLPILGGGCALEFVCGVIRCVYCAAGPLLSTHRISFAAHLFLTNITVPLEMATSLCAVLMLARLRQRRVLSDLDSYAPEVAVLACSVGMLVLQLLLSSQQATAGRDIAILVVINVVVVVAVAGATSVAFLCNGWLFLARLRGDPEVGPQNANRQRAMSKAIKSVMVSGVAQLVVICGAGVAMDSTLFLTPPGFALAYTLIYVGLTVSAWAQALAFCPHAPKRDTRVQQRSTL